MPLTPSVLAALTRILHANRANIFSLPRVAEMQNPPSSALLLYFFARIPPVTLCFRFMPSALLSG